MGGGNRWHGSPFALGGIAYGCRVIDQLDYTMARRTDAEGARALAGQRGTEVLTRRHDGALLAVFTDKWRLGQIQREHPDLLLEPLIAG